MLWRPGRVFGLDIAAYYTTRSTDGSLAYKLTGEFDRLVTRFQLQLGPTLWVSFGVGWQFTDPDLSPYDKGGITLMWTM